MNYYWVERKRVAPATLFAGLPLSLPVRVSVTRGRLRLFSLTSSKQALVDVFTRRVRKRVVSGSQGTTEPGKPGAIQGWGKGLD